MENQWLLELIGKSFNAKSQHQAESYMKEQQMKYFGGHLPQIKETSFVVAHKDGEIKSIGASCVNDLFLDNFGLFLQAIIRSPSTGARTMSLKDDGGVTEVLRAYSSTFVYNLITSSTGTYLRMGSGTTVPARGDFKIETLLGSAPESSYQGTGDGVWNSGLGKVTCASAVVSAGAGTVNETGFFSKWLTGIGGSNQHMMAHDAISPAVPYVIGQTLTNEYTFNL